RSAACADRVLEGGDTGQSEPATVSQVSTAVVPYGCRRHGKSGGCGWGGRQRHSTLLGPEGTTESRHCAVRLLFQCQARRRRQIGHGGGADVFGPVLGWSLVENCTV